MNIANVKKVWIQKHLQNCTPQERGKPASLFAVHRSVLACMIGYKMQVLTLFHQQSRHPCHHRCPEAWRIAPLCCRRRWTQRSRSIQDRILSLPCTNRSTYKFLGKPRKQSISTKKPSNIHPYGTEPPTEVSSFHRCFAVGKQDHSVLSKPVPLTWTRTTCYRNSVSADYWWHTFLTN